ncbi:MAG: chromosome partitioning protein ParB, partial [Muribaculaceae bacterium]|nr:chromosome partitioning protein ParB [Muribaculaceae bacterium]
LKLPAEVQLGLRDKRVDMGHARALLTIDDHKAQLRLYNQIVKDGLSVRRVEELAKILREGGAEEPVAKKKTAAARNSDYDMLQSHLSTTFGMPVKLDCSPRGIGKISFPFKNEAELAKLITIFDTIKQQESSHE